MQRNLYEDVHEDFRASFRTFLQREVIGEDGRYGEWERDGHRAARGVRAGRSRRLPRRWRARALRRRRRRGLPLQPRDRRGVPARAASAASGSGITLHNDICLPYFLTYCNEEQRERWLPGIVSGELITRDRDDRARDRLRPRRDDARRAIRDGRPLRRQRREDVHHQRDQRRPRDHRREDRPRASATAASACSSSSAAWRASSAGATSRRSASTRRTPPSCSSPTCTCRSRTCSARRARASATSSRTSPQERLSIAASARRRRRGGARLDARLRARAQGLRPADRLLPELALRARRAARRGRRSRAPTSTAASQALDAGELTAEDAAIAKWWCTELQGRVDRPLPAAARRLRLHDRVPDRARLRRRARDAHLRRHQRDHEGDHRPLAGAVGGRDPRAARCDAQSRDRQHARARRRQRAAARSATA